MLSYFFVFLSLPLSRYCLFHYLFISLFQKYDAKIKFIEQSCKLY
nr:MAG TPA: hypothetical protein [Caudoviricetes sp.]